MKIFIGNNCKSEIINFIERKSEIILVPPVESIENSTAFHPDLQFFPFDETTIVSYNNSLTNYFNTIITGQKPRSPYPNDILYNTALVGNKLFCNIEHTEKNIIKIAKEKNIELINVNQGYTKCSMIILSNKKIITADSGIHRVAIKNNIESLLVTNEEVRLDGYKNGFIGGTAIVTNDELLFLGDISKHPYFEKIKSFSQKKVVYIQNLPLYDYGVITI